MIHDEFPTVELHNVAATEPADWAAGSHRLRRVPGSVLDAVNVKARERYRRPAGCELRFVPADAEATVSVTLSAASETVVRPFWGEFQGAEAYELGSHPRTLEFAVPDGIARLRDGVAEDCAFDPGVCRLRFDAWEPVAVHDVTGRCRPPTDAERPARRYLAYGTSITEGAAATGCHLTYVSRIARELGLDALNLGAAGAAFCEPAIADHVATRDDWDVATLALSVNMANRGFTVEQFQNRVTDFVDRIATARPDRPIACVTLFPYHADVLDDDDLERAEAFRGAVRRAVEATATDGVSLIDGPDVMDAAGLTTDVLHPGDAGMASIADGIGDQLAVISADRGLLDS